MRINILYQFDEKYAPYAGVSLTSLLENNAGKSVRAYLAACPDVSAENRGKFGRLAEEHGAELVWLETGTAMRRIESLGLGHWNGSLATWLKMFVLDQIGSDCGRLLYLDCDTIVCGNIEEITGMDMGGMPVAAALDSVGFCNAARLGAKEYHNAGVILFDMEALRASSEIDKIPVAVEANAARYIVNDQDLLNDFWAGRIARMPVRFNFQGFHRLHNMSDFLAVYGRPTYYGADEIEAAEKSPVVEHFFRIFGEYPWERGSVHPCRKLFLEWKARSLWNDEPEIDGRGGFVFFAEKKLFRIMPRRAFLRLYKKVVER